MRAREGGRYKINYKEPAGRRRYEQQTLGHDAKGGGPPRGRRPFAWLVFTDRLSLLCVNHAEESGEIIVRTRGEVELVGVAVGAGAVTKCDSPELVDVNDCTAVVA